MTSRPPAGLAAADLVRIQGLLDLLTSADSSQLLTQLAPGAPAPMLAPHLRFDHAALLCFPNSLAGALAQLRERGGMTTAQPQPSVIVKDRLAARAPGTSTDVRIIHASPPSGVHLEIFMLVCDDDVPAALVAEERTRNLETHFAFRVDNPRRLPLLRRMLTGLARLTPDGGGFNPHHRSVAGGSTCLYFRGGGHLGVTSWPQRLELIADGYHPEILRAHGVSASDHGVAIFPNSAGPSTAQAPAAAADGLSDHENTADETDDDVEHRMLMLLTGAWTTQAIRTAAHLHLADHLRDGPLTTDALADCVAANPDRLLRLLRYLEGLDILTSTPAAAAAGGPGPVDTVRWRLTPLGATLHSSTGGSLRDLALLYGGMFYRAFGGLPQAITATGTAFAATFGEDHFDYMAKRPKLAQLFGRGMAAGSRFFADVSAAVDLSGAERIVDVGGGNGELLSHLLAAAPAARGVLLDAQHVIEVAGKHLAKRGIIDRCDLVAGDFTAGVPGGGDVYVLSRILHDWDDNRCATILKTCHAAMPDSAQLLVLERALPDDHTDCLARRWDLHMMANVGGRERTRAEYRDLLRATGFDLVGEHRLPLEMSVLVVRPVGS